MLFDVLTNKAYDHNDIPWTGHNSRHPVSKPVNVDHHTVLRDCISAREEIITVIGRKFNFSLSDNSWPKKERVRKPQKTTLEKLFLVKLSEKCGTIYEQPHTLIKEEAVMNENRSQS